MGIRVGFIEIRVEGSTRPPWLLPMAAYSPDHIAILQVMCMISRAPAAHDMK